jgi:hypothetical protein
MRDKLWRSDQSERKFPKGHFQNFSLPSGVGKKKTSALGGEFVDELTFLLVKVTVLYLVCKVNVCQLLL